MSEDGSSNLSAQLKSPQYLANENEFESPSNQMQLTPSRAPLNSIPDPSQSLKTHNQLVQHHSKEKAESFRSTDSKKIEAIAETELLSSFLRTSLGYTKGEAAHSEPSSAQSIPQVRSGPGFPTSVLLRVVVRSPGVCPQVSRRISVSNPEQLPVQIPHFELDRVLGESQCADVSFSALPFHEQTYEYNHLENKSEPASPNSDKSRS